MIQRASSLKDELFRSGIEYLTEPFDGAVDPTNGGVLPIAAGATANVNLLITQEADFVVEKLTADVTPIGALFTYQMTDTSTGRVLSNQPIISVNGLGTAQRPRLWKPRLFRRNSTIQFIIVNISLAPITRLQICLSGYKIFDRNALNLNLPVT